MRQFIRVTRLDDGWEFLQPVDQIVQVFGKKDGGSVLAYQSTGNYSDVEGMDLIHSLDEMERKLKGELP